MSALGPPLPGAPWPSYDESDLFSVPAAQPAIPASAMEIMPPPVDFGPPLLGAPFAQNLLVEYDTFFAPANRPPGPPGPQPKVAGLPFLPRVPDIQGAAGQDRFRRFTEVLSDAFNSLVAQGILVQTGSASWTLNLAGGSGIGVVSVNGRTGAVTLTASDIPTIAGLLYAGYGPPSIGGVPGDFYLDLAAGVLYELY